MPARYNDSKFARLLRKIGRRPDRLSRQPNDGGVVNVIDARSSLQEDLLEVDGDFRSTVSHACKVVTRNGQDEIVYGAVVSGVGADVDNIEFKSLQELGIPAAKQQGIKSAMQYKMSVMAVADDLQSAIAKDQTRSGIARHDYAATGRVGFTMDHNGTKYRLLDGGDLSKADGGSVPAQEAEAVLNVYHAKVEEMQQSAASDIPTPRPPRPPVKPEPAKPNPAKPDPTKPTPQRVCVQPRSGRCGDQDTLHRESAADDRKFPLVPIENVTVDDLAAAKQASQQTSAASNDSYFQIGNIHGRNMAIKFGEDGKQYLGFLDNRGNFEVHKMDPNAADKQAEYARVASIAKDAMGKFAEMRARMPNPVVAQPSGRGLDPQAQVTAPVQESAVDRVVHAQEAARNNGSGVRSQ